MRKEVIEMSKGYVAKILKNRRQEAGYSVKDISEKFNKSIKTIYSWENGQGQPDADTLISLCYLYGIQSFEELDELKKGTESDSNDTTKLILFYNKLNMIGQQEAVKRLEELTYIEKYTRQDVKEQDNILPYHYSAKIAARNGENTILSGDTVMTPDQISKMMEKAVKDSKDFKI